MPLASLISDLYEALTVSEVHADVPPAEEQAEEAEEQEEEEEEEPEDIFPALQEGESNVLLAIGSDGSQTLPRCAIVYDLTMAAS